MTRDVVIVGSGNVAEALAVAIAKSEGYRVVQVMARNERRGGHIARLAGALYSGMTERPAEADIYLIAVSDDSITEVSRIFSPGGAGGFGQAAGEAVVFGEARQHTTGGNTPTRRHGDGDGDSTHPGRRNRDAVVAHTAGSVGIDELVLDIENRGVFYPLQTFTAGVPVDLRQVPLLIEGSTKKAEKELRELASALSEYVYITTSQQRLALHAAAVFASNFTNHMYASAQGILAEHGLPAGLLKPLIAETARKAAEAADAADVQTGPAARGDRKTVDKHLELLRNDKRLQELYKLISSNIWETSKKTSQK